METRGDVLIWGLWESQTDSNINIRLGDDDTDSYTYEPMDKHLDFGENEHKDKHGNHWHKKWIIFTPFSLSVDGMLRKEALLIILNLSRIMAEKAEEHISHVRGWVNGRIVIAIARS